MLLPMAESDDLPAEEDEGLMGAPAAPQWSVEQEQTPEEGNSANGSAVQQGSGGARTTPLMNTPAPAAMGSAPGDETGSPRIDHNNGRHLQDRHYSPTASRLSPIATTSV